MPRCSVLMCKNDSRSVNVTNGGVSYHRFPKDPYVKEKWIDSTGRKEWFPGISSTVCSEHFDPQDITLSKKGYKFLKDTAVPTRNVLSFHVRASTTKSKPSSSSKSEDEVPLSTVKSTSGHSRKRNSNNLEDPLPTKTLKVTSNYDDDDSDDDTSLSSLEKQLECMLRYEKNKAKKQSGKLKQLKRKYNRLKMSIPTVDHLYKVLNEKRYLQYEDTMCLETIDVQVSELVTRRQTNVELSEVVSKLTYSRELRDFALSLHFLSAEAYDYVRQAFKTSLPHPRTLKHWHLRTDGEPGFTKEAFVALKKKAAASTKPILATLVIDDMDIRRSVAVDDRTIRGYMDVGTGMDGDTLPEANSVLAFMVTAINGHFKVPVAYFLTSHVSPVQIAQLVKRCIELAHDYGIEVVAVTVDSKPANEFILNKLGCNIDTGKVSFEHPVTGEPIVAVIDPAYNLKSLAQAIREHKTLIDKDGKKVQWKHLKQLKETLYPNKKLKEQYYENFQYARIEAKRLTRPFNASITRAMQYCRKEMKHEAFKDSEPTEKFLAICNTVSDLFYYKNILNKITADRVFETLNIACEYITELKGHGYTLIRPQTFKSCISAVKLLHERLIETNVLESLPLYKLSTDPLQLFFWNVREDAQCLQLDPTPMKVIHAYKRVAEEMKAKKNKNPAIEQIAMPKCASPVDRINRLAVQIEAAKRDRMQDDPDLDECVNCLSHSREEAVVQIAGYIVQQLIKKLSCDVCVEALVTKKRALFDFVIAEDKNRLLHPSPDVVKICETAERCLNGFDGLTSRQGVEDNVMMAKIMRQFVGSKIFDEIGYHQIGEFPERNHVTDLMKAIVQRYARIHYSVRVKRETFKDVIVQIKKMWKNGYPMAFFG